MPSNKQKWRKAPPEYVKQAKARWREKTGSPKGRGKGSARAWTQEEDKQVHAHKVPDAELAVLLGRSVTAIQVHRSKTRKTPGPCGPCSGPGVTEACEHTRS